MNLVMNMPAAEYHAHPAVNKSLLDRIAKSPMHARAYLDGARTEPTAAMILGTAVHTAILEPARFASEYRVFEGDRRTKAGKEEYAALQATGATIIDADDYATVKAMAASVRANKTAASLLQDGIAEASIFWKDTLTGVECKCRPDWITNSGIVVDVKTTEDASPAAFARSVMQYRYAVQAAHYLEGTEAERFVFIAVEKKAPYAVACYELDVDAMNFGDALRIRDLEAYAGCVEFNVWPGYPDEVQPLSLPAWATRTEDE